MASRTSERARPASKKSVATTVALASSSPPSIPAATTSGSGISVGAAATVASDEDTALHLLESLLHQLRGLDGIARLRVAANLLFSEARLHGVTDDKIRGGGGLNELLVSLEHGHVPSAHLQGADSTDEAGLTYEHKNSNVRVDTKLRSNFNYRQPTRHANEALEDYLVRVRAHWLEKASGGHMLSILRGTTLLRTYRLAGTFMADYMCAWTRWYLVTKPQDTSPRLNFGSLPCSRCGEYRRVRHLQDVSAHYRVSANSNGSGSSKNGDAWTQERWVALFELETSHDCPEASCAGMAAVAAAPASPPPAAASSAPAAAVAAAPQSSPPASSHGAKKRGDARGRRGSREKK